MTYRMLRSSSRRQFSLGLRLGWRPSELANILPTDVKFFGDKVGFLLPRSKTDQLAVGRWVYVDLPTHVDSGSSAALVIGEWSGG